jgi:hypothetical protein
MSRREQRFRTSGEVTLIFDGRAKIKCQICDISEHGAKLLLPYFDWLPPRFELRDITGLRRHVALAWQGQEHIGVRFIDAKQKQKSPAFGKRRA